MTEFKWSNKLQNRSRTPHLFVKLPENQWQEFKGESISGIIAILHSHYTKNGKWSGYDYTLGVKSAIVIEVIQPFNYFGNTWSDHEQAIHVLVGEYNTQQAARELLPLINYNSYKEAVQRANDNDKNVNSLL